MVHRCFVDTGTPPDYCSHMIEDRLNVDQANAYLDRMFGDRSGFIAMAFGHNPRIRKPRFAKGDFRAKYYAWPSGRDELIGDVDDAVNSPETRAENVEIFINPALRASPSRLEGTHAPLMWVWADLDHAPTEDQVARINQLGAMSVLSGTDGHRHVYLPLTKPVTSNTHQAMCRALRAAIGGDNKIKENDLLRLPGTLNWKSTRPTNVWLKYIGRRPSEAKVIVERLTNMTNREWSEFKNPLPDEASSSSSTDSYTIKDVPPNHPAPARKNLPLEVKKAFDHQPDPGQRNNAIFKLIATSKEQGLSHADTTALVWAYPPAVSKWGTQWRISNDVNRIWQKAQGPDNDAAQPVYLAEDSSDDGTSAPELKFYTVGNLIDRVAKMPAPQFLFEDIVMAGDYGLISAEDKAGKSFVMMDAAVSAASGTPWVDKYKTLSSGPVVICVGEGRERKQVRRILAIGKHKGLTTDEISKLDMHIMMSVPTLRDEAQLDELEMKIREVKPVLVIIDPFYLAAAGINLSQINEVGTVLKPLQAIIERHNTALMISHHWNKTGTGDAHSRASGVGLTAWGRFLISIEIAKSSTDPYTRKTTVLQKWHIKGDEVMTDDIHIERAVWTDSKDPQSEMHYTLLVPDAETATRSQPIRFPQSMKAISELLSENADGIGFRGVMKAMKEKTGRSPSNNTAKIVLDQLCLHGYAQEGRAEGRGHIKPYFHLHPFDMEVHAAREKGGIKESGLTNGDRKPSGTSSSMGDSDNMERDLDFTGVGEGPRRKVRS